MNLNIDGNNVYTFYDNNITEMIPCFTSFDYHL